MQVQLPTFLFMVIEKEQDNELFYMLLYCYLDNTLIIQQLKAIHLANTGTFMTVNVHYP